VAKKAEKRGKRRLLWGVPLLLLAGWLALSHFVARPQVESWLQETFEGESSVSWALVWPDLDVTAFGAAVEGEHFRLAASRVRVGINAWSIFGGPAVSDVSVYSLEAEVDEGAPLRLFRAVDEGELAGESVDLDPVSYPPLEFIAPRVSLRPDGDAYTVFETGRLAVEQIGDRTFAISTDGGTLAWVPFEKLTARLIPRAGHLLLNDLKLRAFNGMIGGVLDVNTDRAGAFNGELECHFVEAGSVWRTYGLPFVEKRRGDIEGEVVFRGERPALDALEGNATIRLERAAFFSPLSFEVFLFLKVPAAAEAPLSGASMTFSFENSLLYLEAGRADARDFHLDGQGIVSFGGEIDMEVSHAGTTVAVTGRLADPGIEILPLNHVTTPFHRLFRERVGK